MRFDDRSSEAQRKRSQNSPWRRGSACDTPAAKLSHLRYAKRGKARPTTEDTK